MRIFRDAHYDFLATRRKAYLVSGALLAIGLFFLLLHRGVRYGVEFTGGTLVQVTFAETTTVGELREAMADAGIAGAQLQRFGESRDFLIRMATFGGGGEQEDPVLAEVRRALDSAYGESGYEITRTEAVGPKVGGELRTKAAMAILLSFALTLVYLAFRFEWRFGVAAIVATFHDILLTFGFLSVLDVEITLATVAAILTIIGYSLNDTIVVFDRIRENLKKRRKDAYEDIVNASINETLPRTVLTSSTTLVTLIALFLLGGAVIQPFALVLILGIVFGTYSSIWVASPALLEIEHRARRKGRQR